MSKLRDRTNRGKRPRRATQDDTPVLEVARWAWALEWLPSLKRAISAAFWIDKRDALAVLELLHMADADPDDARREHARAVLSRVAVEIVRAGGVEGSATATGSRGTLVGEERKKGERREVARRVVRSLDMWQRMFARREQLTLARMVDCVIAALADAGVTLTRTQREEFTEYVRERLESQSAGRVRRDTPVQPLCAEDLVRAALRASGWSAKDGANLLRG